MNRKRKFRAWDKEDKQWTSLIGIETNGPNAKEPYLSFYPSERLEIVEWTGLTDKNGKEIWEGDILGNYWWGERHGHVKNAVVEWDNSFTGFTVLKNMVHTVTNPELEVIGNIYENPELLK